MADVPIEVGHPDHRGNPLPSVMLVLPALLSGHVVVESWASGGTKRTMKHATLRQRYELLSEGER